MRPNHPRRTPETSRDGVNEESFGQHQFPSTPRRGRGRRNNNGHEASGSRDPHVTEQGTPHGRMTGGIQISSDNQPMKQHFIILKPGVDVIECILGAADLIKKGFVIISGLGTVSRAVMPQNVSNPVHEGCFQIASLSGTCLPDETNGRHGDITVLLSDRTGAVIGGVVESLIAESNVQIAVGSFNADIIKPIEISP